MAWVRVPLPVGSIRTVRKPRQINVGIQKLPSNKEKEHQKGTETQKFRISVGLGRNSDDVHSSASKGRELRAVVLSMDIIRKPSTKMSK